MPQRLQRRRAKGWQAPPDAVYVGRPTKWGNPFIVGRDGTAEECLDLYRALAFGFECCTSHATHAEQVRARAAMLAAHQELKGKDLPCWCRLDRPCHADLLLEIANLVDAGAAPVAAGVTASAPPSSLKGPV